MRDCVTGLNSVYETVGNCHLVFRAESIFPIFCLELNRVVSMAEAMNVTYASELYVNEFVLYDSRKMISTGQVNKETLSQVITAAIQWR